MIAVALWPSGPPQYQLSYRLLLMPGAEQCGVGLVGGNQFSKGSGLQVVECRHLVTLHLETDYK